MQSALDQRSIPKAELQMALKWHQFCLYYQPQVDRTQRVVGVQALLRWQHHLDVIAEGVETPMQREFLERHGCHAYQGYLYCRPLSLEQFEAFGNALTYMV